jgi:hypothetical protein
LFLIYLLSQASDLKLIPCFQDQAAGAVFAVLLFFLFFEDAEGFAGELKFYKFMDAPPVFQLRMLSFDI